MKNSFLLLLLVILVSSATLIGQRGPHHRPMLQLTDELKTELSLTPEQITAIETLQAENKAAAEALHEQDDLEREDRRAAMRELHQNAKTGLAEILSDEQMAQLRNLRDEKRTEHRELMQSVDRKAMREELQQYRQTNIEPVMAAQRSKLEEQLSTEDKAALEEFRATLAEAKEQARTERRDAREQKQGPREERGERRDRGEGDHPPHMRRHHPHGPKGPSGLREKHPEIYTALTAMVERYDTEITPLLAEVADQHEQWMADQKAIKERYLPAELKDQSQARHERRGNHSEHEARREQGMKIHFLLREPQSVATSEAETETANIAATAYPNPAANATTLTFELVEEAVIRIDLRDEQGGLVKNITRDTYQTGKNQVTVDLSDLNNGTYYLTLNSRTFKAPQSVKVVLVK